MQHLSSTVIQLIKNCRLKGLITVRHSFSRGTKAPMSKFGLAVTKSCAHDFCYSRTLLLHVCEQGCGRTRHDLQKSSAS